MAKMTLKALFHMGSEEYKEEYEKRFNNEDTIHLQVAIGDCPAFICQTSEIYKSIVAIERLDKKATDLYYYFPQKARNQFASKCLIDEIILTNDIEGVYSTRKEIDEILQDLSKKNKRERFFGLVSKYIVLQKKQDILLNNCQDIRKVYDDIFYEEIKANDPDNLPDGEIFRKLGVNVQSATQKIIHKGLYPESKIIKTMEQSLTLLNDDSIDILIRIAAFHYLFGYIHPFYDGNGRTSRFISSYLLSKELTPLIGFRLSYTIKESISKYYKAFSICNDPRNKGELTPFVEMFLHIIETSMWQLIETLQEKKQQWDHYSGKIPLFPNADKTNVSQIYDLLIQAALFSNIGIRREELEKYSEISANTLRMRLHLIPENLLIVNRQKGQKYYLLNLDELDILLGEM